MLKFVTLAVGNSTHLNYTFVNLQEYLRIRFAFQSWAEVKHISRFCLFFFIFVTPTQTWAGCVLLHVSTPYRAGARAAMIYRLIMFISAFLFPTRAGLSVPFKLWHIITSFGASKLACQTWAGAAILPFQTEQLFRYLLFLLVRSPGTCQKSAWCSPFSPFALGSCLTCVPAALSVACG